MTKRTRRKFTSAFKTKVVLEVIKERSTIQAIAAKYEIHPNQLTTWKKEFLANAEKAFEGEESSEKEKQKLEQEKEELYNQIGHMKVQIDFLKKKVL